MGFSATGNLLPGSMQRPDIVTFMLLKPGSTQTGSTNCRLNLLGYIPVVSTITGLGRALLGLVHTIVHLACSIFSKNRDHHLEEAKLGAKNIGRGLIEAIPVIGNITMFIVDLKRMNKFEKMAKDQIDKNKSAYNNQAVMFIYGQEIAKRPINEFNSEMEKLNKKPTQADIERIIRNEV
jgi:hypothetical protein